MLVTVEKLSPVLVEFSVEVPAEQVKTEVEKAYSTLQRTARVKGFRAGKVPRQVLTHVYGGRVTADVMQRLVDATLNQAIAQRELQALSQPDIAPNDLKVGSSFSYKARFEVRPDIERVTWEGFQVRRPSTTPTEAMVDAELERLRQEQSTLVPPSPERAAREGDTVTLAFSFDVAGKAGPGGEQELDTQVGSGRIFKELDDAIVGMANGDTKDVPLTFPDNHPTAELRGKPSIFHLTVKEIKERKLPDLDDEFAKDCAEDNLAALREAMRGKVEKELKQRATDAVAEQLVDELCKANVVVAPPSLVDQQAQLMERELVQAARRAGQRGELTADVRQRLRADAEMKVRAGLLMAEIAKEKKIQINDADIEKGYVELAEQTGKNVAKVKAEYRDAKKREMLLGMILEDKILDLLEGAATVTDEPAPKA